MDLLDDTEAAKAILQDAEAVEAQQRALFEKALADWRAATAAVKQALASPAEGF